MTLRADHLIDDALCDDGADCTPDVCNEQIGCLNVKTTMRAMMERTTIDACSAEDAGCIYEVQNELR